MGRNLKLDLMKGIACLLMIFPHNKVQVESSTSMLVFLGGLAPVLFFAVSGIILISQLERKQPKELVKYYSAFFLLGFTYNGVTMARWDGSFLQSEILQVITISNLLLILTSRCVNLKNISYFFPIPFLVHLTAPYIIDFPLKNFIFRPGVFPVFPWLSFFLLGIFFNSLNSFRKKVFAITSILLFITFAAGYGFSQTRYLLNSKWDMSIPYFIFGVIIFVIVFLIVEKLGKIPMKKTILFLGKNSLLFLYVNIFAGQLVIKYINNNNISVWIISLLLTVLLMKILLKLNKLINISIECWPVIWITTIGLTFTIPFLPVFERSLLSYLSGFFLSMNYSKLNLLFELPAILKHNRVSTQKLSK